MPPRPSPYECPYCGGPKCGTSRYCIWCQARAVEQNREHRAMAAQGPAAYWKWYHSRKPPNPRAQQPR